jgi:hypothetical protein
MKSSLCRSRSNPQIPSGVYDDFRHAALFKLHDVAGAHLVYDETRRHIARVDVHSAARRLRVRQVDADVSILVLGDLRGGVKGWDAEALIDARRAVNECALERHSRADGQNREAFVGRSGQRADGDGVCVSGGAASVGFEGVAGSGV